MQAASASLERHARHGMSGITTTPVPSFGRHQAPPIAPKTSASIAAATLPIASNVHRSGMKQLLHSRRCNMVSVTTQALPLALAAPLTSLSEAAAALPFCLPCQLMGGMVLGLAAVANLLANGRVLGISGTLKGLLHGEKQPWRFAFVLGLLLPVSSLAPHFPGSFVTLPATMSVTRTVLSGFLVGLGTTLGNGCTSGHGVCGISRLSLRSIIFTAMFMAMGMLSVWLAGSAAAVGLTSPAVGPISATTAAMKLTLLTISCCSLVLMGVTCWALKRILSTTAWAPQALEVLSTVVVGAVFSTGLILSEMTNPAKVIAALAIGTSVFDPSMILVMIGAVSAAILPFQLVIRHQVIGIKLPAGLSSPILCNKYALPTSSVIDGKLILGAVLFGIGWGLAGMCPGPALVSAVASTAGPQVWGYLLGMVGGMAVEPLVAQVGTSQSVAKA